MRWWMAIFCGFLDLFRFYEYYVLDTLDLDDDDDYGWE